MEETPTFDAYTGTYPKSNGGTETMYRRIKTLFPAEFEKYQIIASRVTPDAILEKRRILWLHEDADEPSAYICNNHKILDLFEAYVFVTYAQFYKYCEIYPIIKNKKCHVIQNAIDPIKIDREKDSNTLRFVYHTTPHRGLESAYNYFDYIRQTFKDSTLDVFSSFNVYGWGQKDSGFKDLFEKLKSDPNVAYHGYQPNSIVKEKLKETHIFLYPTNYPETSCIAAIEAQSAKNLVIIKDIETDYRRPLEETLGQNCVKFKNGKELLFIIEDFKNGLYDSHIINSKLRVDNENNFDIIGFKWKLLFQSLENENGKKTST